MNCLRQFRCAACKGTGVGADCPVCDSCLGTGVVWATVSAKGVTDPQPARVGAQEATR